MLPLHARQIKKPTTTKILAFLRKKIPAKRLLRKSIYNSFCGFKRHFFVTTTNKFIKFLTTYTANGHQTVMYLIHSNDLFCFSRFRRKSSTCMLISVPINPIRMHCSSSMVKTSSKICNWNVASVSPWLLIWSSQSRELQNINFFWRFVSILYF